MSTLIPLLGSAFVPTTSVTGNEPLSLFRGRNAVVRGLGDRPYIENYAGSRDLNENYDLTGHSLTGTLAWTAGSRTVTGTGTAFLTALRAGQAVLSASEIFFVSSIESDTSFTAARAPSTTLTGQTGYHMLKLFEVGKKRGVLRRGNAIEVENKDLVFVGDGDLYLNGTDTTFNAGRVPKRLQRAVDGTYTEMPLGFPAAPPVPVIAATTGGAKGMLAGKYAFMVSWYCRTTKGFSNPSSRIKETSGTDITLATDGRFSIDVTTLLAEKPTNADGILIWGTLSGGGVTEVNEANYGTGALYEAAKLFFGSFTISSVNDTDDELTITAHPFKTGDSVVYTRSGGTTDAGGLTSGTRYFVIVKDRETVKLAANAANMKTETAIDITGAGDGTQTLSHFDSSDLAYFEYLDTETGSVVSGDNDEPPECDFVAEFANRRFYISCFGSRTSTSEFGSSPGSFVVPGKEANVEAAPYRWRVTVEEEITGFAKGIGRLFCQTPTGISFISRTGRTEIARQLPTPLDMPFTSSPLWSKGGLSPHNLTVIQADVYSFSGGQPLRAPSAALNKPPLEIGKFVLDLLRDIPDEHVFVTHDPKNQQAIFILSAVRKNSSDIGNLTCYRSTWPLRTAECGSP